MHPYEFFLGAFKMYSCNTSTFTFFTPFFQDDDVQTDSEEQEKMVRVHFIKLEYNVPICA